MSIIVNSATFTNVGAVKSSAAFWGKVKRICSITQIDKENIVQIKIPKDYKTNPATPDYDVTASYKVNGERKLLITFDPSKTSTVELNPGTMTGIIEWTGWSVAPWFSPTVGKQYQGYKAELGIDGRVTKLTGTKADSTVVDLSHDFVTTRMADSFKQAARILVLSL